MFFRIVVYTKTINGILLWIIDRLKRAQHSTQIKIKKEKITIKYRYNIILVYNINHRNHRKQSIIKCQKFIRKNYKKAIKININHDSLASLASIMWLLSLIGNA